MHPVGTVPTVKMHPVGSLPWMKSFDFWPYKWILWVKKMTARDVYFSAQGVQDLCSEPCVCVCLSLHPLEWAHSILRFLGPQTGLHFRIWTEAYREGYIQLAFKLKVVCWHGAQLNFTSNTFSKCVEPMFLTKMFWKQKVHSENIWHS